MKSYEFFPLLRSILSGRPPARAALIGQVLCVFCALLPIIGYSVWSEWQLARRMQQEQMLGLADVLASKQLSLVNSTRLLLFALSLSPTIREEKPLKIERFLSQFEQGQPDYAGFAVLRPDGTTIAGVLDGRRRELPQQTIFDRPYFRDGLSRNAFNVGEALTIPGDRIVLPMTMPVPDSRGQTRALLLAPLSMTRQHASVKKLLGQSRKNVLILDAAFKPVLFHLGDNIGNSGDAIIFLKNTLPGFLRARSEGFSEAVAAPYLHTAIALPRLNNEDMTGAVAVLRHDDMQPYLYILAFEKRISLTDFVRDRYATQITALTLAALLLLFAAGRMGRQYFSKGLVQLAYAALKIRSGDLRSRCGPVQGCRELSILGSTFDQMLDALQARTDELREISFRDPLTGLWNRRRFTETATREIALALRHKQPLSVAMADIDHFKNVNDTWGHAVGDEVLRHFARILRENLRSSDLLARFGGEEFIFLFPHTPLREGKGILEKLRVLCETSAVTCPEGTVRFTASFGVASLDPRTQGVPEALLEALTKQADAALYISKNQGRNQVTAGTGDPDDDPDAAA